MKTWIVLFALLITGFNAHSEDAAEAVSAVAEEVSATPVSTEVVTETEAVAEAVEIVEDSQVTPPAAEAAAPSAPTFVVILPERIDHAWYWLLYTDTSQHIVQSAIEKALIRAGLNVIDLNTVSLPGFGNDLQQLMSINYAVEAGKTARADYVITGQATAVKASEGFAYGVNVFRSQAEITAKIVRVSDGKILEIEDASMLEGGQSAQAAGQSALKKAGTQLASKIARAASKLAAAESPVQ
jgi:hypothetical protein